MFGTYKTIDKAPVIGGGEAAGGGGGGGPSASTVLCLKNYATQSTLANTIVETTYCSSGAIPNESLGMRIRVQGNVLYSTTGVPSMSIRMVKAVGTPLVETAVPLANNATNEVIHFDLSAQVVASGGFQTFASKTIVIESGAANVTCPARTTQIFVGAISPLLVSLQWSAADPANTANILTCSWEISYPLTNG